MKAIIYFALGMGLLLMLNACKVGRFVVYNFADIKDYKKFPARSIAKGEQAFLFHQAEKGLVPKELNVDGKIYTFDNFLEEHKTVAFLIIQNDSIQYEKYWGNYNEASIVPSFSMAKSISSILIGCAIDDQLIASVNEPITHYIPELMNHGFDTVTIEHLLQMTSGLDFNESYYNPFGDAATFYYGTNLRKSIANMTLKSGPAEAFEYLSGNTQLLGLVLERALKR